MRGSDQDLRRSGRRLVSCQVILVISALATVRAHAGERDASPPERSTRSDDAVSGSDQDRAATEERPYWRRNLFKRFGSDQKFLFTTWWPSEFRRPGFSAPLLAGTALAFSSSRDEGEGPDLQIERRFSDWTEDRSTSTARMVTNLGDGAVGAVLLGTTYLVGRWSGHDGLAEASSLSAEALLDVGLYSIVLKGITARTRPAGGGEGNFLDFHPAPGQSADSFPSGHAMDAFAIATVFAGVYHDHRWVPWVAYGTAGLVGVSRVALGRHFPSDVLVGAVLGNSFGRMVLTRQGSTDRPTSRLQPFTDPAAKQAGLVWSMTW